jgi:hypothetical protein
MANNNKKQITGKFSMSPVTVSNGEMQVTMAGKKASLIRAADSTNIRALNCVNSHCQAQVGRSFESKEEADKFTALVGGHLIYGIQKHVKLLAEGNLNAKAIKGPCKMVITACPP